MSERKSWKTKTIKSFDGTSIRAALYCGHQLSNKVLVFINGRSEWIEKYNELARDLNLDPDIDVITWDHRGQGASEGLKGHIDSYSQYMKDGQAVLESFLKEGTQYSILAHSMGGLIALLGTLNNIYSPDRLILSAPLLKLPNRPLKRWIYIPISKILTQLSLGAVSPGIGGDHPCFHGNTLTQSVEGFNKVLNTPYPIPSPTFAWISATDSAIQEVFDPELIKKQACPIDLYWGSEESVVDPKGFSEWIQKARSCGYDKLDLHMIPGARHELLNEIDPIKSVFRAKLQDVFS